MLILNKTSVFLLGSGKVRGFVWRARLDLPHKYIIIRQVFLGAAGD